MDYGYSNLLDAFSSLRNLKPGFLDDPLLELPRDEEERKEKEGLSKLWSGNERVWVTPLSLNPNRLGEMTTTPLTNPNHDYRLKALF